MARKAFPQGKALYGAVGLLFLGLLVYAFQSPDLTPLVLRGESVASKLLTAHGIHLERDLVGESSRLQKKGRSHFRFLEQRYRIPSNFLWNSFRASFDRDLSAQGLKLMESSRVKKGDSWVHRLEVGHGSAQLYRLILESPKDVGKVIPTSFHFSRGKGKIAIVLDDWGYNLRQLSILSSIRQPLTVAVLPGLAYSNRIAREAKGYGHEVILHMPMEADNPRAPREAWTILTGMSAKEVAKWIEESIASVPFARGVSNHQGSRATADRRLMGLVLGEVKRRDLYFLDSLVTEQSVCGEVAKGLGVPFTRRSVFLDNEEDPQSIGNRLTELSRLASKEGKAIGIGHDRPLTLKILQAAIPALQKAGYTLVLASELAE